MLSLGTEGWTIYAATVTDSETGEWCQLLQIWGIRIDLNEEDPIHVFKHSEVDLIREICNICVSDEKSKRRSLISSIQTQ